MRRRREQEAPEPGTARLAAIKLLGRRDYTSAEITKRLLDRGHSSDEVTAAVVALTADHSINDRRAAGAHVRTAGRIKGRGRMRIRRELEARGVPPAVISDSLNELGHDDEANAIDRVLARRQTDSLDPAERRKLFAQLLRRGFAADLIAKRIRGVPIED